MGKIKLHSISLNFLNFVLEKLFLLIPAHYVTIDFFSAFIIHMTTIHIIKVRINSLKGTLSVNQFKHDKLPVDIQGGKNCMKKNVSESCGWGKNR